jgi:cell division protein FtsL
MTKFFRFCQVNNQKHSTPKQNNWLHRLLQRRPLVNIMLFGFIIVLGICYLWQINITATSGFAVKDLNSQLADMQESQQKLQLQIADLQSLQRIQLATGRLKLSAKTRLQYINNVAGTVALEK